ncbi:XRE family transcriptional regulator [Curtobacterium sp. L1-20]|uniref:XRE family transcriptional regulator n=1 Tax=Curtobacterium sp. L1-20 TaxID=3138181 RepID=UPI003B530007
MPSTALGGADEFSRAVAHAIEDARSAAGLTTRELIKRSGLSPNYYYRRARGELPFTTNDMSALAAACDVSVGALWTRAQAEIVPKAASDADVVAGRVNKLLAVARAQFPRMDLQAALLSSDVARDAGLAAPQWHALLSGELSAVTREHRAAVAAFFGVPEEYLLTTEVSDVIDDVDARLDVQEAFAQTGAHGASSRGPGATTPASLRALARAIRESNERGR